MIEIAIEKKEIGGTPILSDIKWKIEEGITLIMGPSGSGKTTLLREMIPRINRVGTLEGTVCYRGMPIDEVPARCMANRPQIMMMVMMITLV